MFLKALLLFFNFLIFFTHTYFTTTLLIHIIILHHSNHLPCPSQHTHFNTTTLIHNIILYYSNYLPYLNQYSNKKKYVQSHLHYLINYIQSKKIPKHIHNLKTLHKNDLYRISFQLIGRNRNYYYGKALMIYLLFHG